MHSNGKWPICKETRKSVWLNTLHNMQGNGAKNREWTLVRLNEIGFTQTTEVSPTVVYINICVDGELNCGWHFVTWGWVYNRTWTVCNSWLYESVCRHIPEVWPNIGSLILNSIQASWHYSTSQNSLFQTPLINKHCYYSYIRNDSI